MDPRVPAYHAQSAKLDWSDRDAVLEYQVGDLRLLTGSAHPFDEASMHGLAQEDWDRTQNTSTPFNHPGLRDAEGWA
jgi:hypothetical protein